MDYLIVGLILVAFVFGVVSGRFHAKRQARKQAIIDGMTPSVRKEKGL